MCLMLVTRCEQRISLIPHVIHRMFAVCSGVWHRLSLRCSICPDSKGCSPSSLFPLLHFIWLILLLTIHFLLPLLNQKLPSRSGIKVHFSWAFYDRQWVKCTVRAFDLLQCWFTSTASLVQSSFKTIYLCTVYSLYIYFLTVQFEILIN